MTKQEKIVAEVAAVTAHKNIHVALAVAQSEMGPLIKGAMNPHFKKSYADLSSVIAASGPALNANGISYHSEIRRHEAGMDMVTVFTHGETDTSIECAVPLIVAKNDMQGMKSATTYAKRVGHESLSGLAPEDDDGNAAAKAAPQLVEVQTISAEQFTRLRNLAEQAEVDEGKLCELVGAASLQQFPADKFDAAMKKLGKTVEIKAEKAKADDPLGGDEIPYQGAH